VNERIQELEKQATDIVKCGLNGTATAESFNRKKFAELIVKECINIADKSNTGSKSSNEGTEFYYNADIGDKIKEHFGLHGMSTEDKKTLIKELLGVKNETN
jgi:hypothetical protein